MFQKTISLFLFLLLSTTFHSFSMESPKKSSGLEKYEQIAKREKGDSDDQEEGGEGLDREEGSDSDKISTISDLPAEILLMIIKETLLDENFYDDFDFAENLDRAELVPYVGGYCEVVNDEKGQAALVRALELLINYFRTSRLNIMLISKDFSCLVLGLDLDKGFKFFYGLMLQHKFGKLAFDGSSIVNRAIQFMLGRNELILHDVANKSKFSLKKEIELIRLFLLFKADVNIKSEGETALACFMRMIPLHTQSSAVGIYDHMDNITMNNLIKIINIFIENSVDLNAKNENGNTVLMLFIERFNKYSRLSQIPWLALRRDNVIKTAWNEITNLLLKYGANVNIQNKEGKTALMFAAERDLPEIVSLLLEHGADTEILSDNKTAKDFAGVKDYNHIVKLIDNHRNKDTSSTFCLLS